MARIIWSLLCKRILTDDARQDVLVAIIDPLDNITLVGDGDPAPVTSLDFQCKLVTAWARSNPTEPEEATARVRFEGPGGQLTYSAPFPIELKDTTRARTAVNLKVLPFYGAGRYEFVVTLHEPGGGWRDEVRHLLDVDIAPRTTPPV